MSHSGDIDVASVGTHLYLEWKIWRFFSVNFHFLTNDKTDHRDCFIINTIDDGLSFGGIKSILLPNIFCSVLYIPITTYIRQVGRISALEYFRSSLIWKSRSKCVKWRFQKFVGLNFSRQIFSTIFCYFIKKNFT